MPIPKAAPKPEETWQRARLIPTTGIGGQDEQEQRATSSLLAVIGAVPQFGRAILDLRDPGAHDLGTRMGRNRTRCRREALDPGLSHERSENSLQSLGCLSFWTGSSSYFGASELV
jgi:hypothetical protein